MKVVALIPARSGSKGVPDKNIKPLGGHPLLAWSIAAAKLAQIKEVYVSSDSQNYLSIACKYGGFPIPRPAELASDQATDKDYLKHFVSKVACDLIILLRPTTPLRNPKLVQEALARFLDTIGWHSSLRSVEPVGESPYKFLRLDSAKCLISAFPSFKDEFYNLPRQNFETLYHPNGYVDILRVSNINRADIWGDSPMAFITRKVVEIDNPSDWDYLEWLVERGECDELKRHLDNTPRA